MCLLLENRKCIKKTYFVKSIHIMIKTGIIIGRFQVANLESSQKAMLEWLIQHHDKAVLILGESPVPVSPYHPLDFRLRREMIREVFPQLPVFKIPDTPLDSNWSQDLDGLVRQIAPGEEVILYGDPEHFINRYKGAFPAQPILPETNHGESDLPELNPGTADYREGIIYACRKRYPTVYATVDIALLDQAEKRVLLGRKALEKRWRFIGGFSDPGDDSFEAAARRELFEETDVQLDKLICLGSSKINDWRYRLGPDKVISTFFAGHHTDQPIQPKDDIAELQWFDIQNLSPAELVPEHLVLFEMLFAYLTNKL